MGVRDFAQEFWQSIMGIQESPESPGIPSGKELVSFGDLERGVCSSIDHLRPRIREPEGGSAPASVSEFGKRFDGCPGFRVRDFGSWMRWTRH